MTDRMQHLLVEMEIDRVDLVPEGANSESYIKIFKGKGQGKMTYEEILQGLPEEERIIIEKAFEDAKPEDNKPADEDAAEKIARLEEELKAKSDKIDELESMNKADPKKETEEEDILKGVSPAVKAMIDGLNKKAEAAETFAKSIVEKEAINEAKEIAKSLKALPTPEEELVDVLKGADPKMVEILKSAAALVEESGVLKEKGTSAEETKVTNAAEAWGKIEAAAVGISKERNITKEAAVAVVLDEQPDLYAAYTKNL